MTDIDASLDAWGESFSPARAEEMSGLRFTEKAEPGATGTIGKYKGAPTPYGSASLRPPEDIPSGERIMWLATRLDGKIDSLRLSGASEIHVSVAYYRKQGNAALSAEELRALSQLGIDFWFTTYGTEDDSPENK